MNKVKRIKPVRINAVSFVERFKGREVKLLKGYNADGSRRINHGIISNAIVIEKDIYCVVVCEKGTYHCSPEWLIHSGNDFSK